MSWRKASYSVNNGACVEVADFRKSSWSHANGNCVEVGAAASAVRVRDTVNQDGVMLAFPAAAWKAFIRSLK
jgi:hypothetical protein